ncbi:MAG: hypothetical protein E6K84_01580 [Thaumarchaeota archaeon]|nr:MAG: hypothetical protein E6K84_01580 [Nitrososphaerota archaeon]
MREAIPSLELNGVNLFYAEKGAGEPVVFVHGIPTDYRAWDSQLDSFSEHYRAIAYGRRYAYPNAREGDLLDSRAPSGNGSVVRPRRACGLNPSREESKE